DEASRVAERLRQDHERVRAVAANADAAGRETPEKLRARTGPGRLPGTVGAEVRDEPVERLAAREGRGDAELRQDLAGRLGDGRRQERTPLRRRPERPPPAEVGVGRVGEEREPD